ncbi:hypothetical protein LX97_01781 [Nonlabens dokdonensis]|uniref:Uncharacterized protein n=2 Tax=Nonlabens dokdonensis TaxID=328515 RepID=L7W5U3_NONDD|nr:hypothetical protein [Nonlabens dokdonensis]AGC77040.1 hypothetical protein DDD_1913 [Nonlabens dokdonensis DSW-6]PZX41002.1 hypothetical protein LX97_01781 [Nonlabens dokdonensis]
MKKILLCLFVGALTLSCSSDDDNNTIQSTNFYGLKVGNSWTYQFNDLQGTWNENMQMVEITGTQVINGEDYFIQESVTTFDNGQPDDLRIEYLREDSQGFLVDSEGFVRAHPTDMNFTGVLPITSIGANVEYRTELNSNNLTTTVPAGTFTNSFLIDFFMFDNQSMQRLGTGASEYTYAPEIGLIEEKISFSQSSTFVYERVLVNYIVN